MSITLIKITPTQHASASEWLIKEFRSPVIGGQSIAQATPTRVRNWIMDWYPGGWDRFLADDC